MAHIIEHVDHEGECSSNLSNITKIINHYSNDCIGEGFGVLIIDNAKHVLYTSLLYIYIYSSM